MELKCTHFYIRTPSEQLLIVLNGIEIRDPAISLPQRPLLIVLNGIEIQA